MYFTVETYQDNIVPYQCTTGHTMNGQFTNYPVVYIAIFKERERIAKKYYADQGHVPIYIPDQKGGHEYTIYVEYEWMGSPAPDYTLKVYSKYEGLEIRDAVN